MSSPQHPAPGPAALPAVLTLQPAPRSGLARFLEGVGKLVLALTTMVNLLFLLAILAVVVFLLGGFGKGSEGPHERLYAGKKSAGNKIAVIRVEGVLFEGLTGYARRQIDAAAGDDEVKAIVVRIVSPGGTITASDDLHKRLNDLRSGHNPRHPGKAKPIVVSMGSIAASGGYYIAMIKSDPPTVVFAEPTTITGSIGVYASFPNVKEFADKHGFKMNVIKAGDLKYSGSMFKDMDVAERQVWQDMIDHSYLRFLDVIGEARAGLDRKKLQEDVDMTHTVPVRVGKERTKHVAYKRYRADGAVFTASQAQGLGLIDRFGYLDDAVAEAAKQAGLGDDYQAFTYDRPSSLLGSLLDIRAPSTGPALDTEGMAATLAPRLWYLAPQHELSGWLTALGHQEK
jgi:protease-4